MRISQLALVLTASLSLACAGGDGDGDGDGADAATGSDAGDERPDASTGEPDSGSTGAGATALGQECTPTPDNCPEGHACLPLDGATHPWCSVPCPEHTQESDLGCEGYEGAGAARCMLEVTPPGGGESFMACLIVCGDETGSICRDGDDCDGTCPHGLTCVDGGNFSYCG